MKRVKTQTAALTAHASTPNGGVRSLRVQLRTEGPDILVLQYSLVADMSRLRVPLSGTGGRGHALWKHMCFEAFIAAAEAPGYHEFNFSPSLEWAIYRFSAYREGMSPADSGEAPKISVRRGEDSLELSAALNLRNLVDLRDARRLRAALAAIIEDDNGSLSYWGLRHAPAKPDFHHPNGFAVEIERS
jgi:hypothetical protein